MSVNEQVQTDFREDFKKWFEEQNGNEKMEVLTQTLGSI